MTFPRQLGALALAGLVATAAPFAVMAQTQQAAPAAETVTSDEVDAFVVAYESVLAIDEDYGAQMAQASDDSERQSLQEEAQVRKTEAVQATPGIDVERYVEILTIAQANPDLSARIVDKLER